MRAILSSLVMLLVVTAAVNAQEKATQPKPNARAAAVARSWQMTPDPALPNVLILGDSISIGYGLPLRAKLQGKANVYRPMSANGQRPQNCSGTTFGVEQIDRWLAGNEWDVIHFNWGLHDLKHVAKPGTSQNSTKATDPVQATVEQYSKNLESIVAKLEATGAKLIFATTTPVVADSSGPLREVDAPARYNEAALKIMKAHEIEVNDLYAACEGKLSELQLPKNVHFNKQGSEYLAEQVAAAIEKSL
ncbi:SGNH/GDSL hydrolase family protein [Rhodopirellula sp. ICT_H3.1]|uniref:SGNH/GDSL hydrolase family protein n=2 Tax=Aporhodopirellula aestuarii TaxID=2950107 RepID=A0ABT0TZ12_9BACT|nr:SGNH/GDSL hydrolase family protein [Aporhodopirellula aestuarii]